ncbi:MAG: hypothetical protein GF365_04540 [Candidatus Buchananbacteria bacterium]|nr:hypothetical protein [Candidatus Buchananbacteria bacterium]
MKNANYNLIKMLHNSLDDLWRLENFYIKDAKKIKCKGCQGVYEQMRVDLKKHINLLQDELAEHIKKDKFE